MTLEQWAASPAQTIAMQVGLVVLAYWAVWLDIRKTRAERTLKRLVRELKGRERNQSTAKPHDFLDKQVESNK